MRRLLVFVAAAVFSAGLSGQPASDSVAVWWRASGSAAEMNFNPALAVRGDTALVFAIPNTGSDADMIVVYGAADSSAENGLWQLEDSLGARIGLTTQRILGGYCSLRYGEENVRGGVINYLSQSWDGTPAGDTLLLTVGRADILTLDGSIAEAVCFGHRITAPQMTQWMSYLAVKYGVTLWHTDYTDSRGNCVWSYAEAPDMSDFIAGVGRDDHFGLNQTMSRFFDSRIIFSIPDGPEMEDGTFILLGTDSVPLATPSGVVMLDDTLWELFGVTRVQVTGMGASEYGTQIAIGDTLSLQDSLPMFLLVDRSGAGLFDEAEWVSPSGRDSGGLLLFDGLRWDTDRNGADMFCLARKSPVQPRYTSSLTAGIPVPADDDGGMADTAGKNHAEKGGAVSVGEPEYTLYPNPNNGSFTLDILYPEQSPASVRAYTQDGRLLRVWECDGGKAYKVDGRIDSPGYYLLEIRSPMGNRTVQMVVN